MKSVNKTYKFVYYAYYSYYQDIDEMHRVDYSFGNRMPDDCNQKFKVHDFFFHGKNLDFLPSRLPANEANITLAFVKKFTYMLNQMRRKLTYLNKNPDEQTQARAYNTDYIRKEIKFCKENLAIWKAKYQSLKDQGVYTYLELVK